MYSYPKLSYKHPCHPKNFWREGLAVGRPTFLGSALAPQGQAPLSWPGVLGNQLWAFSGSVARGLIDTCRMTRFAPDCGHRLHTMPHDVRARCLQCMSARRHGPDGRC